MSYINESVIYTIYPLGFCGAPRENDFKQEYRLNKILDCIGHFKKLNVNAIVFNPLFESSRHGYDTIDYKKVDSRLGDNNSFKAICKALHDNGIKILLDGVFNHVGRDFFAFKDVQQKKWDSPYCSWFQNLNFNGNSPYGDPFWYEGWAGNYDLVKLNLHNNDVVNYLLGCVNFWIDEFDIDGLRLDAADCVDIEFFKKLRHLCKSRKEDFWLYGEITHGDYTRWANNEALDSVTNYECYKGIFSSHNDHNYFEIAHSLRRQFENGGIYHNIYTYNFVDNHDVNRLASSLKDKKQMKNCYTLMYTMPGVPSIYYGSEYGIEGARTRTSDYELRPCLDLNNVPNADMDLFEHICRLGKVRRSLDALKYGKFANVNIMNEKLVYKRFTDNQTVFVVFNLTDRNEKVGFDTGCNAKLTDVLNNNEVIDVNGYYEISMQPYSTRILVVNDGSFKVDYSIEEVAETSVEEISAEAVETTETVKTPENSEENIKAEISESAESENIVPTEETATDAKEQISVTDTKAEKEEFVSKFTEEIELGRYRHYSGKLYEVIGFAKHSETGEKLVIYTPLYDGGEVWARPYKMFIEVIDVDGEKVQRFTSVD
ncbi:MAG: DUF1653 domain-containing protein [Ruminococcus sp.]|nr:DUF1653 domain-containing protein [Ruminococcus sp.]